MVKKYFLKTFGCQMNYSDSERFAAVLQNLKCKPTGKLTEADIIVINTCSVRQRAEDRVVGMGEKIEKLKKTKPDIKVILTGCMTKREKRFENDPTKRNSPLPAPHSAGIRGDSPPVKGKCLEETKRIGGVNGRLAKLKAKLPWVDIFLKIEDLPLLPAIFGKSKLQIEDYFSIKPVYNSKFQAFVPISTGCNNFCSYCIVPFTRGPEKSRPFNKVIQEVKTLIENGYKEMTLLGQNVNSYGNDFTSPATGRSEQNLFPKLLQEIDQIDGTYWIRFISSHPKDLSDELIETIANGKHLVPYIHFAMQSGNNNVLERMNRPYTIEKYLDLVKKINDRIPQVAVTTDIIVGFPNETEGEFEDTVLAMKKAKFSMAYLNQYSPRKGAKSYAMKDNVPAIIKNKRKSILNEVLIKTSLEFNRQFLNKKIIVLFTSADNKGITGHTAQGVDVKVSPPKSVEGQQQRKEHPEHHYPPVQQADEEWTESMTRQSQNRHAQVYPELVEELTMTNDLLGTFAEVKITEVGSWGMRGEISSQ